MSKPASIKMGKCKLAKSASRKVVVTKSRLSNKSAKSKPKSTSKSKSGSASTSGSSSVASSGSQLRAEGVVHSDSSRYDCCVLLVHCAAHDQVLLATQPPDRQNATWMPFTQLAPNRSWRHGAMWALSVALAGGECSGPRFKQVTGRKLPLKTVRCVQVARVQKPQTLKFYSRVSYYMQLTECTEGASTCAPLGSHLKWVPMAEVLDGKVDHLWGAELVEFAHQIKRPSVPTRLVEYSLDNAFLFVPRNPPRNLEEELLQSLRITEKTVERLYADFLDHCFPCLYMTFDSFRAYLAKYECERDQTKLERLFTTFNVSASGFLTFHELLMGLACIEPSSQHSEFRVKFLFRYYDMNKSRNLSSDQLRVMLADMGTPANQLDAKVQETMTSLGGANATTRDLIIAIGTFKFRGTSALCRSNKSIFTQICRAICQRCFRHRTTSKKTLSSMIRPSVGDQVCQCCKAIKYDLATHQVTFNMKGGQQSTVLDKVVNPPPCSSRSSSSSNNAIKGTAMAKGFTGLQYSQECVFNASSAANAIIRLIREFNSVKGTAEEPVGLLQDRKEVLWKLLLSVHNDVTILLDQELKCHKVNSPCYIIGDVHGNLEDLLSMERVLWNTAPAMPANLLFLGDYVDRGQWGLECSLYLMALKVLCPNKVTLLRGNHEVRELQENYSYKNECVLKYDLDLGLKVWELTNRVFDRLPACAVVDEAIYCAHGGIPRAAQRIDQIGAVQKEVRDPEKDSAIVWEILWSDPCPLVQFIDVCEQLNLDPDGQSGFVPNVKRNTAFLFSDTGLTGFLRNNFLTHVVRAHEVAPVGYEFHFGTKCVTIFSCSHYCGNENLAGLVLAADQRLRVIIIDTANNAAATD